jgi:hypothetical protein
VVATKKPLQEQNEFIAADDDDENIPPVEEWTLTVGREAIGES